MIINSLKSVCKTMYHTYPAIRGCVMTMALLCAAGVEAQEVAPDTVTESKVLQEVVVSAPKVIKKIDKDLYYPSAEAKRLSANGLQLLNNLSVPTLVANDVMGTLTAKGNSVQVRINGRVTSVNELKQIAPENVKRVEWISNPGMKYDGATAVINVITVNPTTGGSLMAQAMSALNNAWGQGEASLKLNSGKSQWSFNVDEKLTNKIKSFREYHETFTYPDGQILNRTEEPIGGALTENHTEFGVAYNYVKPDTTMIYVKLSGLKMWNLTEDYRGLLTMSDQSGDILLHDKIGSDGFTPGLSAYLEQHLGKGQILSVDASAAHYDGYSRHVYTEQSHHSEEEIITDVNTSIHDRNTSFGATINYEKEWSKSKFTAGALYGGARNKSTYERLGDQTFHQSQNRFRLFGEYRHSINKVTLTGGLGVQYSSYLFRESNRGKSSWDLRPQVTFYYSPTQASWWYMSFFTRQTTPTLDQTNNVARQIDGFQWELGNPDLKTYSSYTLQAEYGYSSNRFSGQVSMFAETEPNAIAPYYHWEGDRLISTYENSRHRQQLAASIAPTVHVIPGWATLSGFLRWGLTRTEGTGYSLRNHNWSGNIQAVAYHWNFQLILQYEHQRTTLIGERETWGQRSSFAMLAYNWGKWQFAAGLFCPFNRYDQGSRLINRYISNEKHIRSNKIASMPFLQIAYNLQWGRQKRGVDKRVNADTSVERSKAGSR